jgi:hypothetical protein
MRYDARMKSVLAVLFAAGLVVACSDATTGGTPTQEPTTSNDGGTTCQDTGFNPEPCVTEAGHTYSFIENAGTGGKLTVVSGATMDFSLNGGSFSLDCQAGSTCDVTVNGGTATVTCAATAKCSMTCTGGNGTFSCNKATSTCQLDVLGGQCVQP